MSGHFKLANDSLNGLKKSSSTILLLAAIFFSEVARAENIVLTQSGAIDFLCGDTQNGIEVNVSFSGMHDFNQAYYSVGRNGSRQLFFETEASPVLQRLQCLTVPSSEDADSFEHKVVFHFAPQLLDFSDCKGCAQQIVVGSGGNIEPTLLVKLLNLPNVRESSVIDFKYEFSAQNIYHWLELRDGN